MKRLKDIQNRDRIIWGSLCGLFGMLLFVGWLYYREHINKTMRLMTEKENQNLRLAKENLCKEKEKAEPVTKDNAAKVCKDFIFNAGSDSPLYDYVPDALDKPSTLEIGKTKDDVEGFSTSFAGSYFDEKGKITCLIAGTKGDPKVYSITFAGRQIYGDATSWMKPVEEDQE